jgi:hypothetical protein
VLLEREGGMWHCLGARQSARLGRERAGCAISPYGRKKSVEAYCVKCRGKKEMQDPKAVTLKNGKPATAGVCPDCGGKLFRIGKAS